MYTIMYLSASRLSSMLCSNDGSGLGGGIGPKAMLVSSCIVKEAVRHPYSILVG